MSWGHGTFFILGIALHIYNTCDKYNIETRKSLQNYIVQSLVIQCLFEWGYKSYCIHTDLSMEVP